MSELVVQDQQEHVLVDAALVTKYMDMFGIAGQLEPKEKAMFIEIAKAYQLNPFKKEIYCIPYGKGEYRKLSILTGYESYLKRAERTGRLAGWDVTFEEEKNDLIAIGTVHRKDWTHPLKHEVYLSEYIQYTKDYKTQKMVPNSMWASKPKTMLRKVCISQMFRLAFPDELGGMPYDSSELPDEMTKPAPAQPPKQAETVETPKTKKPEPPSAPADVIESIKEIDPRDIKATPDQVKEILDAIKGSLNLKGQQGAAFFKRHVGSKAINNITLADITTLREAIKAEQAMIVEAITVPKEEKDELPF